MYFRCNFKAYCMFSFLNTVVYCIPGKNLRDNQLGRVDKSEKLNLIEYENVVSFTAGWVWGEHGFLNNLGAVDIAGSGPVSTFFMFHTFAFMFAIKLTVWPTQRSCRTVTIFKYIIGHAIQENGQSVLSLFPSEILMLDIRAQTLYSTIIYT